MFGRDIMDVDCDSGSKLPEYCATAAAINRGRRQVPNVTGTGTGIVVQYFEINLGEAFATFVRIIT